MKGGYVGAVEIIRNAFNRAKENTPAILFVDEIETFAPARGTGYNSEIIGQFLVEMDGVKDMKGVVVVGATNRPGMLDPAILRPGRFDKIFYIPPPDKKAREEIFKIHLGPFSDDVDIKKLAGATEGFSGADIASICKEAKMRILKKKISGKEPTIKTEEIEKILSKRKPSITKKLIDEYMQFIHEYGERR